MWTRLNLACPHCSLSAGKNHYGCQDLHSLVDSCNYTNPQGYGISFFSVTNERIGHPPPLAYGIKKPTLTS